MAAKPVNGNILVWVIASNLIVAAIVGSVAYYGTSSSIDGAVSTKLAVLEKNMAAIQEDIKELRTAQRAEDQKRVAQLEAEVIVLKAQLQDLRRLNQ